MNGDFRVGEFLVQPQLNRLVRSEEIISVEPKVMEVLVYLASHAAEVVSKERLLKAVWGDSFVTDDVLKHAIFELRKAFHDDARQPYFIQTIPRKGYRLIALVDPADPLQPTIRDGPAASRFGTALSRHLPRFPGEAGLRYPTGRDGIFRTRGSRVVLGIAAGILLLVLLSLVFNPADVRNRLIGHSDGAIRSLAVLPLENLSGNSDEDYFAAGMHDALIAELGRFAGLRVISRQSVIQYQETEKTIPIIAGELGVEAVVRGSTVRDRETVRVNLQLFDAEPERQLWAESYERDVTNVLRLQGEVARDVVRQIGAILEGEAEADFGRAPRVDPQAYDYYLRGNDYWWSSLLDRKKKEIAIQMYERAIQLDPNFAIAHARLSEAHTAMWHFRLDRTQGRLHAAKQAVDEALRLDPNLPEAHRALGYYYYWGELDYQRAVIEFRRAERDRPGDGTTLLGLAALLRRQGQFDEALEYLNRALALNPRDDESAYAIGTTYEILRDSRQAEIWFDRCIALKPDDSAFYVAKARIYLFLDGNTEKARTILEEAERLGLRDAQISRMRAVVKLLEGRYEEAMGQLTPQSEDDALLAAQIYDLMGDAANAHHHYESERKRLEAKIAAETDDPRLYMQLGFAYAGLGRRDEALRAARSAVELLPLNKDAVEGALLLLNLCGIYTKVGEHDAAVEQLESLMSIPLGCSVDGLLLDPFLRPLHDHPKFQALIRKYRD